MPSRNFLWTAAAISLLGSIAARADVTISKKPTQNMSCSGGVCTPTAQKAVLNATDLANMLAGGDIKVTTGSGATNIVVKDAFSWTSASRLTLDAIQSVEFDKPVSVAGTGAVTIATNDGGKNGDLLFDSKGNLAFWDTSSSLVINGNSYMLVGDIKTLAADIAANPSGSYALANSYDASVDGIYASSPIPTIFTGALDGMGNVVSNLAIHFPSNGNGVIIGLFSQIGAGGSVRDIVLAKVDIEGTQKFGTYGAIGPLAGGNGGYVGRCSATGMVLLPGGANASPAGLIGYNTGTVSSSSSAVAVSTTTDNSNAAGIVGVNEGSVLTSYAQGRIAVLGESSVSGGLVGHNAGLVANSFAVNPVPRGHGCCESLGGLIGKNDTTGQITASYAAGTIHSGAHSQGFLGGLVGFDAAAGGNISSTYWDLDDGVSDPAQGAGNLKNDPGITGLTTLQLQSGLPPGFDPKIWTLNPSQNDGLPYLRSVPLKHP